MEKQSVEQKVSDSKQTLLMLQDEIKILTERVEAALADIDLLKTEEDIQEFLKKHDLEADLDCISIL